MIQEDNPSKNYSQKEELDVTDDIDDDDIGNLEDLLRVVIIYEECGNLNANLGVGFRGLF